MAEIYGRSTDGNNADSGSTWLLAKATLAGADAIDAPGDQIYLSDNHDELTNAALSFSFGTLTSPSRVVCVDDAGNPEPPTTTATTAVVATGNGSYGITLAGVCSHYGITYKMGVGSSSNINLSVAGADQSFVEARNGGFWVETTGSSARIRIGDSGASVESRVNMFDQTVRFAHASQCFEHRGAKWHWNGGGIAAGGTAPTTQLVSLAHTIFDVLWENLDLSGIGSACHLFNVGAVGSGIARLRNIRLPASWTGDLANNITNANVRFEMHNADSGATNYALWVKDYAGQIRSETAVVRTGGASNGPTSLAWRMTMSATAEWPMLRLYSPERALWNATLTTQTGSIEIVHNCQGSGAAGAFRNDEMFLDIQYLASASYPLGADATSAKVALVSPTDIAASSVAWDSNVTARANSTAYSLGAIRKVASNPGRIFFCTVAGTSASSEPAGYATAVDGDSVTDGTATFRAGIRQKISVNFTALMVGPLLWRVGGTLASAECYIDPKLELA